MSLKDCHNKLITMKREQEKMDGFKEKLRDEFAMAALEGLLAKHSSTVEWVLDEEADYIRYAKRAYKYADAMLTAREVE